MTFLITAEQRKLVADATKINRRAQIVSEAHTMVGSMIYAYNTGISPVVYREQCHVSGSFQSALAKQRLEFWERHFHEVDGLVREAFRAESTRLEVVSSIVFQTGGWLFSKKNVGAQIEFRLGELP